MNQNTTQNPTQFTDKEQKIIDSFHHKPVSDSNKRGNFYELGDAYVKLAELIIKRVPDCADRSHALRELRSSRLWAVTAVALEGTI
jgi:hypothetical protein